MQADKSFITDFFGRGLTDKEKLAIVTTHFQKRLLAKNDCWLTEGKMSNEYMVLEEGFMRAFSIDTSGNEVTTAFYKSGEAVFDGASFFMRQPAKESIQALTPCKGWVISFQDLNALFHSIPEFREFGRGILVIGFAGLKLRMQSMITETAETRYLQLLERNPEIFQYAPMKQIASYLGVTDSSLSRIRREIHKR